MIDEEKLQERYEAIFPVLNERQRLFSYISMNWRGRPLISHEVIVNLIGATATRSGLKVKAKLDKKTYPTQIKVSDEFTENGTIQLRQPDKRLNPDTVGC